MWNSGGRVNLMVQTPAPPGYAPAGNNSSSSSDVPQVWDASLEAMAGMAGPVTVDVRFQMDPWSGAKAVMAPETWLLAEDGTACVFPLLRHSFFPVEPHCLCGGSWTVFVLRAGLPAVLAREPP
jgi:hypothetical protein